MLSCQKENFHDINENIIIETKLPPELKAVISRGGDLIDNDENLKQKLKSFTTTNVNSRTLFSSKYNINIDTTYIQHIKTSDYVSYTFIVEREERDYHNLENYVLNIYNDNTSDQYLLSYPELNDEFDNKFSISDAIVEIIEDEELNINSRVSSCVSLVAYEEPTCIDTPCIDPGGANHIIGVGNWQNCTYWDKGYGFPTRECSGGGWVDQGCPDSNGTSGPDSGTGPGGSANNNNNEEDDDLVVVPLTPFQQIVNCINSSTSFDGTDTTTIGLNLMGVLNNLNLFNQYTIIDYLQSNGCSEEAQQYIIDLAESIEENSTNPQNPQPFVSCGSFEYASTPTSLVRSAAVDGIDVIFLKPSAQSILLGRVKFNVLYFNMPLGITNGLASNLTAEALYTAILSAQEEVQFNPQLYANQNSLIQLLVSRMSTAMSAIGGSFSPVPSFSIPSPAPYQITDNLIEMTNCN